MNKQEKAPKYILSALNTPMLNYETYVMSLKERITAYLIGFLLGGCVGLSFYGGQFRDADGMTTVASTVSDIIIFILIGIVAGSVFCSVQRKRLQEKRKKELTKQFRSLLDSLSVSLSTGMNMPEALMSAHNDLKVEYSEEAYIVNELKEIINGIQNNIPIEDMFISLGERSQVDDIKNFGTVFEICYRVGGNMKDVIRRINDIMSEKIEIEEEINTTLTSNKSQFYAMMVIPVVLMIMLRGMSSSFAESFATVPGVIATTLAIGLFYVAYKIGSNIMDIKG